MPLYEYQCDACGHRFETIQKFSDPPVTTCPKCGGSVRKLIASPAFQFKGTGWYITDYAKKDAGKGKGASAESSSEKSATEKADKDKKSDKSEKPDASPKSAGSSASNATPAASASSSKE